MITEKYEVARISDGKLLTQGETFVLKRGDVLATAALRSYVGNILTLLETDRTMRRNGYRGFLDATERDHLESLADDASRLADEWEAHNHTKLPD